MVDLVAAHRRTMTTSIDVVAEVGVADLGRPTPCAGWDLRQLLAHMIGQNYGFAAAAAGAGGDLAVFADRAVGADPAGDYAASARRAIEAFGAPGVLDRELEVAALRGGTLLAGAVVIGAHLVDYVVHSWDVARSLGTTVVFADEVLQVALQVAEGVPDGARSADPATPFGPDVSTESVDRLDQIVANLGRSPGWTP